MNNHTGLGTASKRLLLVMAPTALLLWAFVAMGTAGNASSRLDGHYSSTGYVLLSNGKTAQVSQTLAFNKGRFFSMTRNAPAVAEASGRVETDMLGHASLVVEQSQIHGLGPGKQLDDELMFNLFYGSHQGARITLEEVGACLYGVETRQVYCPDDHPHRG